MNDEKTLNEVDRLTVEGRVARINYVGRVTIEIKG